jgi:hypothetical protein
LHEERGKERWEGKSRKQRRNLKWSQNLNRKTHYSTDFSIPAIGEHKLELTYLAAKMKQTTWLLIELSVHTMKTVITRRQYILSVILRSQWVI